LKKTKDDEGDEKKNDDRITWDDRENDLEGTLYILTAAI
jgi:hypothetical protein